MSDDALPITDLPLAGIRVLDFTHMAAGPFCTTLLGDLGADVIKLEAPGRGDGLRYTDRCYAGDDGSYFLGINRNKRGIALDLKTTGGRDVVRRLVATTDVVIENFRPGKLDQLGLGYADLQEVRADLVYCSIYAFGSSGPMRDRAGMDLVLQATSGIMGLTGHPDTGPVRIAASIADYTGAFFATQSILAALLQRERTGEGRHVEVSLLDGQLSILSNYIPSFFVTGEPSKPVGNEHPQLAPYEVFRTSDSHIIVACLTQAFWVKLCVTLGRDDLRNDPRYATNGDRVINREVLHDELQLILQVESTDHWSRVLDGGGVPCSPVNSLGEALAMDQVRSRRVLTTMVHPVAGDVPVIANPVLWDGHRLAISRPAPMLGEHTEEVLVELGYSNEDIAALRVDRAIPTQQQEQEP